jgi:hypothetical protein
MKPKFLTTNNRYLLMLVGILVLLYIPIIAMQFTSEVDWNLFDFLVMGILLVLTVSVIVLVLRKFTKTSQRIMICGILLGIFFLIWGELAVGIFSSPIAGS